MESIDQTICRLAEEVGFTKAGVAAIPADGDFTELEHFSPWLDAGYAGEMEYLKRRDSEGRLLRSSLHTAFPWARSVIVCAANYQSDQPRSIDPAPEGSGWVSRYAWSGMQKDGTDGLAPVDYHDLLLARLKQLDANLQEQIGPYPSRCYVDTGPLIERVCAKYAGIGWVGKNACLIDQKLGSWFFLAVILTGIELDPARVLDLAPDRCGTCTRCIDACPTDALIEPYKMDAGRCISYLTIEKRGPIAEELRSQMGRQVFGCDICQDVCPWNHKAPVSGDQGMAVRPELVNPPLEWLADLDQESFRRWFRRSPISRAKRAGLMRNVAIAMGNSGERRFLGKLTEWSENPEDPVLREAAQWAIGRLDGVAQPQSE